MAYGDSLSTIVAKELGRVTGGIASASVLGSITGKISGYTKATKTSANIEAAQKISQSITKGSTGSSRGPGRPPYTDTTRIEKAEDWLNRSLGTVPFKLGGNTRLMKNTMSKIDTKLQNLDATKSIEDPTYRASLDSAYNMGKNKVLYPKIQKPLTGNLDPRSDSGLKDLASALNKQMSENKVTTASANKKTSDMISKLIGLKPGQVFK